MFQNLAGLNNRQCDEQISYELNRARISTETTEVIASGEVPYTLTGKLPGFTFTRAWNYWVVKGAVPLSVAEELYADPVGITDIRVAGHCGCPPPKDWVEWITLDGEHVLAGREKEVAKKLAERYAMLESPQVVFSDDPESLGAKQFVTSYHIDSEVGLRVFVDALRTHHLLAEPVAA